jgi:DNA-directed RNA polymerase specialized sigma24 family protein
MSAPKTERNNAMMKLALFGYDFDEISKFFNISKSTARAITFRELRKLAPNMKDYSMKTLRPYRGLLVNLMEKKAGR